MHIWCIAGILFCFIVSYAQLDWPHGPRWSFNFRPKKRLWHWLPSGYDELHDQPSIKHSFIACIIINMLGINFDNACSGPIILSLTQCHDNWGNFSPFCTYMKILVIMGLSGMTAKYQRSKANTFCRPMGWVLKCDRSIITGVYACTSYNSMEIVFNIKAGIYELLVNNIPKNQ